MHHSELITHNIYTDILDSRIQLQFIKKDYDCIGDRFICYFRPIKTTSNANWYNHIQMPIRIFDPINEYIK